MATAETNIRVHVDFSEPVVFAGDDIECKITFRNITTIDDAASALATLGKGGLDNVWRRSPRRPPSAHHESPVQPFRGTAEKTVEDVKPLNGSERPSLVIRVPDAAIGTNSLASSAVENQRPPSGHKHKRSVSIISLGSDVGKEQFRSAAAVRGSGRRSSIHSRPSSAQILSFIDGPTDTTPGGTSPTAHRKRQNSIPFESSAAPVFKTPQLTSQRTRGSFSTEQGPPSFRSPTASDHGSISPIRPLRDNIPHDRGVPKLGTSEHPILRTLPVRPHSAKGSIDRPTSSSSRPAFGMSRYPLPSIDGTPRSSLDMYSASNHSDDTTTSEYFIHTQRNGTPRRTHTEEYIPLQSRMGSSENLMMGFAQISGSFTLDGSLVNEAPFESIKRKAVVGGHGGGGVVGIEKASKEGTLFGSFGWSSIGESLGGLLSGSDLSSIKEMKGIANAKSIPLISTPKSILFVDLNLAPGESRSYHYSFTLPRGLPPSHRGRAIRVSYQLIIGTQRPVAGSHHSQPIRHVEIPFRVFGGVNAQGEDLGHDLMSPYVILKDQARTIALERSRDVVSYTNPRQIDLGASDDFHNYVAQLLPNSNDELASAVLSPSADASGPPTPIANPNSRKQPQLSTRALVDQAIRRSYLLSQPKQSQTHFTIARASVPIASVILSRAFVRLGDTLTCAVDFSISRAPCYAVEFTLESAEVVDPSFAIRSVQSVERATRRIWVRRTESAVWARRRVFTAQVPVQATPGFDTTGVALEWCIRLEMVTAPSTVQLLREEDDDEEAARQSSEVGSGGGLGDFEEVHNASRLLLEPTNMDERGVTLSAMKRLRCQSFDVVVPIRVFGASVGLEDDLMPPGGLAV